MADLGNATLYLGTDDSKMQKGMADAERSTSRTLGAMRTLAVGAGVAAAGAIAAIGASALNVSNETDKATKKIRAQLRTTEKEAKRLGKVAKDVFKNNFADSIEESGEAVMLLSEQLGDAARGQEQALVEAAFGLRDAFGPEVDKVIAAVSTLVDEFDDLDPTQAMDLVVTGFQRGLDKSGDFLDSIGEYSNLFSDAEFSAAEFFSTMETGQAGGVLGTDKIADAMKEFQIRLIEGSDAVSEALTGVGLNADEIFAGLSDGTLSVKDVWDQLLPAINAIEDPLERNRALVELLGTQAEDLGTDFTEGLDSGKTSLEEMEGAAESLNTQYENVTDSISALWRNVIVEISPLTDLLVSMANTHLPAISGWVTKTLPGVVTAMTGFLTDPQNTLKNMFALPDKDVFLIKLKLRWALIKRDFKAWLTTAAERITDFFAAPDTKAFFIKLKFKWLIIKRDFKAWLTTASQRITDFFAAPLSEPLVQAMQSTWTTVKDTFKTWVVDHLVADYIQLPDNVTWSDALKVVWELVQTGFKSWVVDHLIADYVEIPGEVNWLNVLKGVWETVLAGFKAWVVDHLVADYIQLPDNVTWSDALKVVWTSVSAIFKTWVVDHLIADYVEIPGEVNWLNVLKGVWETVLAGFKAWVVDHLVADYIQLPDNVTWSDALKVVWELVQTGFKSWVVDHLIADYVEIPGEVNWLNVLKGVWETVLAGFKAWVVDHLVADYIQLPDNVTWSDALKVVWTSVSAIFKTWVVDHLIADYVEIPGEVNWLNVLKGVWETVLAGFKAWVVDHLVADYIQLPDNVTWSDALKVVWTSVSAIFKTWVVDHLIADYVEIPGEVNWLNVLKGVWETVLAGFKTWVVDHLVADYIQLPDNVTWSDLLKAVWTSIKSTFDSWIATANMKISEFWQLPAVQAFVKKLRDLWDGPEGVKAVFEDWLAHPENRPKITFGYEAPDSESEETKGFFAQLKKTLLAGLDAIFGDIDIIGSLLAPIIALLGTDPEAGFKGIIDKITETLQAVEDAFSAAGEAIDSFFEKFNADIIDDLISAGLSFMSQKLSGWSATVVNGFSALWRIISGIWTGGADSLNLATGEKFAAIQLNLSGKFRFMKLSFRIAWAGVKLIWSGAWDGLNSIVQTAWATLTTFLTESFAMLDNAFAIAMIWINQGWAAGWETIKTTVASAWAEIQATMENLFGGFGEWVQERVSDVGRGVIGIANGIIDVINSLVRAINKPIQGWNALTFSVGGFSHGINNPLTGAEIARVAWGGIRLGTPDVPTLPSVSRIGYGGGGGGQQVADIAMLASGGLALGPTMAMIGEREPEAVLRMDQLRDFAGVGDGTGTRDLHLHIENAYGIDNLVDQLNEAWLDGRLRGLQDQLAGVG